MSRRVLTLLTMWYLLCANTTFAYTHADTLRGSNGRGREWWDVKKYKLQVDFNLADQTIQGSNTITFTKIKRPADSMQIDLQDPMVIDSIVWEDVNTGQGLWQDKAPEFVKDSNVWWILPPYKFWSDDISLQLTIYFHGSPRKAVNPPWDGGFSWTVDSTGKPWVAVSCQGLGASVWWPCKDAQWDEPDSGMDIRFRLHDSLLSCVSNGRGGLVTFDGKESPAVQAPVADSVDTIRKINDQPYYDWAWHVKNPINNYDVTFYIGDYIHWSDTLLGEKGNLDLDFWVLRYNEARARKQFAVVKPMLHCFEYWMGPYPFYEDGYKLVEAPYLGMEHQSAVAYGNKYRMGYLGRDRSETGVGMNFDYIIVHESGHEWFGNNITARDIADNWIQEGITTYSESLFAECLLGKEKGQQFCRGEWNNIRNERPMIGDYGVNKEGPGDIYDKGAAIMHMIRVMTDDDEKFRSMLRGLTEYYHCQTVTTQQVENFIAIRTGLDLTPFFNQYLRMAKVPEFEYTLSKGVLSYRYNNMVPDLKLPVTLTSKKATTTLMPSSDWQFMRWDGGYNFKLSKDYLISEKE